MASSYLLLNLSYSYQVCEKNRLLFKTKVTALPGPLNLAGVGKLKMLERHVGLKFEIS